jgi:tetratricopeptide (TPR) repeat protein
VGVTVLASPQAQAAAAALAMVGASPRDAQDAALEAQRVSRRQRDRAAESVAGRALGLARKELGDLVGARTALRAAVRVADRAGLDGVAAEARMSLAFVLLDSGRVTGALAQADRAVSALRGVAAARLRAQRGLILQRCGRLTEAQAAYQLALPVLARAGDRVWEARLRNNRGLLRAFQGSLTAAEADLRRAAELHIGLGNDLLAADCTWNLGFVAARRGDAPAALACYDATEATYHEAGVPAPELLLDRAEVLLSVGLNGEAAAAAADAAGVMARLGLHTHLAEARLVQAQAALAGAEPETAGAYAEQAAAAFRRQQRPGWALVARHVAVCAASASGSADRATLEKSRHTADALRDAGWAALALDARIITAETALALGRVTEAEAQLRRAAAARRHGSVAVRVAAWHAEVLLRVATGRRGSVAPALRAGLRVLDQHRAALGATELRVHTATHGARLTALGLRLALEDADAVRVLTWAEQWRAATLRLRPARPPDDAALTTALIDLRRVSADLEAALLEGRPVTRLRHEQAALEAGIRAASRRVQGQRSEPGMSSLGFDELAERLGDRALVALVDVDATLWAVVVAGGRARLHEVGSSGRAADELESVHFALRRLASRHGSDSSLLSADRSARDSAARLDAQLLAPLRSQLQDREVVLVPPAVLQGLPISLLPTVRGRATSVAPSATVWARAAATAPADMAGRAVLAAGPRLAAADEEVTALAARHPHATRLTGPDATVAAVAAAADGAHWVHLAAHGRLRTDNPLFSSLELSDGPLTVYDLERLHRAPRLVVLPACHSGVGSVHAGEETLGLTSALLALGSRTVVASIMPVPDDASRWLMLALHDAMAKGSPPAAALAAVQAATDDDPSAVAAAAGFVCLGAG